MILCVQFEVAGPAEGAGGEWLGDEGVGVLLDSAPRAVVEWPRAWLDVRGLEVDVVHGRLRRRLRAAKLKAHCGVGTRPVVAGLAAAAAAATGEALMRVEAGGEREFLAGQTLAALGVEEPLLGWLADVGVGTCGELAGLTQEAVEVRFGGESSRWWRLARGEDERRLFAPVPPSQPSAAVDFVEYVVTDPERLIFMTNALLGGVCERMRERGTHARRMRLRLPLANGTVWERTLKTARPTADRGAWLRLARALLERLTVPDAVSGVAVAVESTEAAASVQGDLFDSGFATAAAVEAAVARVLEDQGEVLREPVVSEHPLVEQRGEYRAIELREVLDGGSRNAARRGDDAEAGEPVGLTLQLLPEPRPVSVETAQRRDHAVPVRYRDGRWHALVHAAGPDRVSGGRWDVTYAREYFRAVTTEGALVWLFRDASRDRWYLHGWWD